MFFAICLEGSKVLNKIAEAWKADREHIVASSDKIVRELQKVTEALAFSA